MKILYLTIGVSMLLSGCLTLSGNYRVFAQDSNGKVLNNRMHLTATGSGIYTTRNALCATYPKSIVVIVDDQTGKNLDGESPYQCR